MALEIFRLVDACFFSKGFSALPYLFLVPDHPVLREYTSASRPEVDDCLKNHYPHLAAGGGDVTSGGA